MEQGWQDESLLRRLTGTRYSSPPPVTAIRPCASWARTAAIGRFHGTHPPTLGTWASILGIRACTTAAGAMGSRCVGSASECRILSTHPNPHP